MSEATGALSLLLVCFLCVPAGCNGDDGPTPDTGPTADAIVNGDSANDAQAACVHPEVKLDCKGGWCRIPAGCFLMGRQEKPCPGSPEHNSVNHPEESLHQVTLTRDFEIMAKLVTRKEYIDRMGKLNLPPNFWDDLGTPDCGPDCPVVGPTWYESVAYCNNLSEEKGLAKCYACKVAGKNTECDVAPEYQEGKIYDCPGYRLATEAEFEYAYRAGTTTDYYNGEQVVACEDDELDKNLDPIAWYKGNSSMRLQPVGQLAANGWGLFDMAGNSFEWVNDLGRYDLGTKPAVDPFGAYTTEAFKRVGRGGSYVEPPRNLRASYRFWWDHDHRCTRVSFRCVRSLN